MNIFDFIITKFKSLPDNFQPAILTASATLVGAFIGAAVAQYVSHLFASKRENQKYYREIYQKLFAPVLLDIYAYLDICTHFRKGHDVKYHVDEENILKHIIKSIGNNLMFASPRVITNFNNVKINEYQDDFSGYMYRVYELNLFTVFLEELYSITQKVKLFDYNSKKMVIKYMFLYKVWTIYTEYFQDFERASILLKYKFYFNYKKINYRNYKSLKKYYDENIYKNKIKYLFNKLECELKKRDNKILKIVIKLLLKLSQNTNYCFRYQHIDKLFDIIKMNGSNRKLVSEQIEIISKKTDNLYKNEVSSFTKNLFFFEIDSSIKDGRVVFNIKVRNISENIEEINIDNFKLIKFGEIRINIIEMNSSIYNGFEYILKLYKLLPTEAIKLTISFNIETVDYDGYILAYISEHKTYKLRKI